MSDDLTAELQHWQGRTDDLQVSLERVREERDLLKAEHEALSVAYKAALVELGVCKQMVERMRVAMSQGTEL